jgi:lipid A 3-O-deacylase
MIRPFFLIVLFLLSLLPFSARAEKTPDTLSIGGGGYDFSKEDDARKSFDYRLEYRWGISLLPKLSRSFDSVEPFFQVHPALGIEGNSKGAVYGNGGFNLDIPFLSHGIFTWGEAIGAFARGNNPRSLGAVLEFRSQFELGWQFNDATRITAFISHISNAGVVKDDPGAEIVGLYVHLPLGRK